jgi:hypothetical protein
MVKMHVSVYQFKIGNRERSMALNPDELSPTALGPRSWPRRPQHCAPLNRAAFPARRPLFGPVGPCILWIHDRQHQHVNLELRFEAWGPLIPFSIRVVNDPWNSFSPTFNQLHAMPK